MDLSETPAARMAREDDAERTIPRRFSLGTRPVLRWIKGDGRDDDITRAAIGQATRLFGDAVDYCLCTNGIDAARTRRLLAWATQPVEWWPLGPADNPALAAALQAAGCPPERFGYWWKWFPERVRPAAPEWVLDGDMVVTARPAWFAAWAAGTDPHPRVSQDNRWPQAQMYGRYAALVDQELRLYSGLVSLPPGLRFMPAVQAVLARQPLAPGHNGQIDMCEQGVIAAAFQGLRAVPVPLHEFPFARAWEAGLDHGLEGDQGRGWGIHFGGAFRRANPHLKRLQKSGQVLRMPTPPDPVAASAWLGARSQWGTPGWSGSDATARLVAGYAAAHAGCEVLELGTSRGHLTAVLTALGCRVTTLDRHDRGAAANLAQTQARVIQADADIWLAESEARFELILADLHGNAPEAWARRGTLLLARLAPGGVLLLNNARLHRVPGWEAETGVAAFLDQLGPEWQHWVHEHPSPGLAVVAHADATARPARCADADLHLVADGAQVWPASRDGERHVFRLHAPVRALRLRSRADSPKQMGTSATDTRRLGVAIRRIVLEGPGFALTLLPDWQGFRRGFHASEGNLRWTDGDGVLDTRLLRKVDGPVTLSVTAYQMRDYPAPLPAPVRR